MHEFFIQKCVMYNVPAMSKWCSTKTPFCDKTYIINGVNVTTPRLKPFQCDTGIL